MKYREVNCPVPEWRARAHSTSSVVKRFRYSGYTDSVHDSLNRYAATELSLDMN